MAQENDGLDDLRTYAKSFDRTVSIGSLVNCMIGYTGNEIRVFKGKSGPNNLNTPFPTVHLTFPRAGDLTKERSAGTERSPRKSFIVSLFHKAASTSSSKFKAILVSNLIKRIR